MKVLSFTCSPDDKIYLEQILPALLNKTKTQTIRPAWRTNRAKFIGKTDIERLKVDVIGEKQPHYKVGEKIRLEWKSRNSPKNSHFCQLCGSEISEFTHCRNCCASVPMFHKILGRAEITEVFPIEMCLGRVTRLDKILYSIKELWEKDGFKCYDDFYTWFNDKHDLNTPKKFFVYRWTWKRVEMRKAEKMSPNVKLTQNRA
jgi:hypothetical protein